MTDICKVPVIYITVAGLPNTVAFWTILFCPLCNFHPTTFQRVNAWNGRRTHFCAEHDRTVTYTVPALCESGYSQAIRISPAHNPGFVERTIQSDYVSNVGDAFTPSLPSPHR